MAFLYSGDNLLYGLREAIAMLLEEGLDNVFGVISARCRDACRRQSRVSRCSARSKDFSPVLTAVLMRRA